MQESTKHEFYYLLNLLGYGLAKFGVPFVNSFGFQTKQKFYQYFVDVGIVETSSTVKNRQDLFDPFFENGRKGWWQKEDTYKHRKLLIDSLFGSLDANTFADVVRLAISDTKKVKIETQNIKPVLKSCFQQMQTTGIEAEYFFKANYLDVFEFQGAALEDARLFGDGYDFQMTTPHRVYLAEVKGVSRCSGGVRLTEKEYKKAEEYKSDYGLIVISNLADCPKMTSIFDPISKLDLTVEKSNRIHLFYRSPTMNW